MENKEVKNKRIRHINQILCVINQYCDYMESFDRLLCSKIVILIDKKFQCMKVLKLYLHSKIVILIALYEEDLYLLYLKLTFLSITFFRLLKL